MHELPKGWSWRKLMDVVSLPSGQVSPLRLPYSRQPLIAPDHIESETGRLLEIKTAEEQGAISGKYVIQPGDVVYSKIRPALRKAVISEVNGLCSADMYPLRPSSEINPRYLLAVILGESFSRFAHATSGRSGIPKVNRTELDQFEFALPSRKEQDKIVETLNVVDIKIATTKAILRKLKKLQEGIKNQELEKILQKTEEKGIISPLSSAASIRSGVTLGAEPSGPEATSVPYLRVANVQDGYIDTGEIKTINITRSELSKYLLMKGDVLLTEGGDFDKLGRGAVWDARISECISQNHVFRVRCDQNYLIPEFLAAYTSSQHGKKYFLGIAKQTTNLATINSTQLKAMPIPFAPLEEQRTLTSALEAHASRIRTEEGQLQRLSLIKKGVTDDLLTGRVRTSSIG